MATVTIFKHEHGTARKSRENEEYSIIFSRIYGQGLIRIAKSTRSFFLNLIYYLVLEVSHEYFSSSNYSCKCNYMFSKHHGTPLPSDFGYSSYLPVWPSSNVKEPRKATNTPTSYMYFFFSMKIQKEDYE